MDKLEEQGREIAIYRIQCPLVQRAVAEAEGLEITEEAYQEKAAGYVEYYGLSSVEELEEKYTKETVNAQVLADLALELIVENAVTGEN